METVLSDERIKMQSEEIWESLTSEEKRILTKLTRGEKISSKEREEGKYLWETGVVNEKEQIFSPLFERFLTQNTNGENSEIVELSRKENLLFEFLLKNIDKVCERERIIEEVWAETEEFGVSDWTIDRLVARVRAKLKSLKSEYAIVTIKTRGFKLVKA